MDNLFSVLGNISWLLLLGLIAMVLLTRPGTSVSDGTLEGKSGETPQPARADLRRRIHDALANSNSSRNPRDPAE